jgi:hypothetical protein
LSASPRRGELWSTDAGVTALVMGSTRPGHQPSLMMPAPAAEDVRHVRELIADTFVTCQTTDPDHGLGAGGERLHDWLRPGGRVRAGLPDEMEVQLMPVLLGPGRRLIEDLPPEHVELELVRALDGPDVQHLRYRVRSEG